MEAGIVHRFVCDLNNTNTRLSRSGDYRLTYAIFNFGTIKIELFVATLDVCRFRELTISGLILGTIGRWQTVQVSSRS